MGLWKERGNSSIVVKVWTGTCWSWIKVRITGRKISADVDLGSPQLIRHGQEGIHISHRELLFMSLLC